MRAIKPLTHYRCRWRVNVFCILLWDFFQFPPICWQPSSSSLRFLHRGCEFMCLDYHICQMFPFTFFGNIGKFWMKMKSANLQFHFNPFMIGVSLYIMVLIAVMRVFGVFKGSQLLNTVFSYVNVVFMIIGKNN